MRFALIGYTGHWTTYRPVLAAFPEAVLAAVAPATAEETVGGFDHAPGFGGETRRYETPEQLLDSERLDFVQVCCRPDRTAPLALACLRRGLPVVAEKPLAMDPETLAALWAAAEKVPIVPMHTQRSEPWLAAAKQAVASGAVGRPLASYHQKSYKWGRTRPDWYRSRRTFPGLAPYAGIHAFDWLVWLLGGEWEEVSGWESAAARPDFPACASHAGYLLRGAGRTAAVSVDYLRPPGAPTHGDERLRVAGTEGLLEIGPAAGLNGLVRGAAAPETIPPRAAEDWYVRFVRSLRDEGRSLIPRAEAFRATEIALKAQRAAETGESQDLRGSRYVPGE
jgi:predicted dehydrogenase